MTNDEPELPLPESEAVKFRALLNSARPSGHLSLDALVQTLSNVEFDTELIVALRKACAAEGVILDEDLNAPVTDQGRVDRAAGYAASIGDDVEITRRRPIRNRTRGGSGAYSDDSFGLYLKEIGAIPLLSAREEVMVAARIRRGLNAEVAMSEAVEANTVADLDPAEVARLDRVIRDGQRASEELICANLRLVVAIAKRYVGQGVVLSDLVQEGSIGLMRAVEKFDHTKGFKFSTYATWWIRQATMRAIADQARTIRIPVHMVDAMKRVDRVQRQLHQDLKREPTVQEIAAELEESVVKVRELLLIGLDTWSLDSSFSEDDDSRLGDLIEDRDAVSPVDIVAQRMLAIAVGEVLGELLMREQKIMRLRFGIDDDHPRTLEEVGRHFNVTRERVRQIEFKTLVKLRHWLRSAHLYDYLG